MRKCLCIFAVLWASVLISTSGVSAAETPSFGILGGLHVANLSIDPEPTDASLYSITRANIGGLVEIGLVPNVSLQARCMYVRKGAALEEMAGEFDLSARTIIDYVTVPVLLKISAERAKIRPYAVVGPELGLKIRAGASVTAGASVPEELLYMVEILEDELSGQITDYSKSTDLALDFGGGIETSSGRVSVLIEGIYSLGLRNIAIPAEGEEGSAKTRAFLFNIGVRF